MLNRLAWLAVACLVLAPGAGASDLITNDAARQHGLERAWFSQARMNPARYEVEDVVLDGDQLFVLTTAGSLQAFDANTGEVLWSRRIGNPGYPSLGPVANENHVALSNGSSVYVLHRDTGLEQLHHQITSGIGGAPALSDQYVFVPQFSGRVDAIGLENPRPVPWYFTSAGRIFQNAIAGPDSIVWTTDSGHLYVADPHAEGVRYRFESSQPIVAPATLHSGKIFAASTGGYTYALDEATGRQLWRHASGAPITKSPIALGETLFVASDEPALHSLNAKDGQPNWVARGVAEFVSASEGRVYGLDRLGNLIVLDREHGVVRSRARTNGEYHAVLNEQTDRLYLVSKDGLLQCFHEIGAEEPFYHVPKVAKPKEAPEEKTDSAEAEEVVPEQPKPEPRQPPAVEAGPDPFGGNADPFGDNPFGGAIDDDPFGME
jgi:outer membrane protein assembly factor BamB